MTDSLDHGKKMPICIRKYQKGDVECDGRPGARLERDRISCVYRDRCVALQHLMKVSKSSSARDHLKLRKIGDVDGRRRVYAFAVRDSDEFQMTLNRAIDRYGIRNGRVTIRVPQEGVPRKKKRRAIRNRSEESKAKSVRALVKARKAASRVLKQKAADDLGETTRLAMWFVNRLRRKTKRTMADDREGAPVGGLFVVSRSRGRYLTVYCETIKVDEKRGRRTPYRKPVVSVSLGVRTRSVSFRLPVSVEDFSKALSAGDKDKVGLEEFAEGRFSSKTRPLDREGASIIADAIAVAVRKGIINLPEAVV